MSSSRRKKAARSASASPEKTASGIPLAPLPASLLRRLAAVLYETLLALAVLAVTFLMPHVILGVTLRWQAPPAVLLLHCQLVLLLYFCWFWLHGGQTLAMRTWKMRLESVDGRSLRPMQAVLRYLAAWLSLGTGIGIVWALLDRDRQFLHDRIAGTRLVMAAWQPLQA